MTRVPSSRSKQVFRHLIGVFDIPPRIVNHFNTDESSQVDMIHAAGRPEAGCTTYATVTLNEYPNVLDGEDIATEIYGVVEGEEPRFGDALATCALNVITDGWLIAPGVVHEDVLSLYRGLAPNLPHMLFVYPIDGGEDLAAIPTKDGDVHALQGIPISAAELTFLQESGFDALEQRFVDADLNYRDLKRQSVL